jgi:hypothetical protein
VYLLLISELCYYMIINCFSVQQHSNRSNCMCHVLTRGCSGATILCAAWSKPAGQTIRRTLCARASSPTPLPSLKGRHLFKHLCFWSKFSTTLVLFAHLFLQITPHSISAIVFCLILLKGTVSQDQGSYSELVKGTMCNCWRLTFYIFLGCTRPMIDSSRTTPMIWTYEWLQLGIYVVL